MRNRLRRYLPMALAGLLLLASACQATGESQAGQAAAAPDVQATITALEQQRSSYSTPTPTAVPQSTKDAAQKFSEGLQAASQKWEQLHLTYDTWQAGLAACNPTSVRAALGQFAGQITAISQSARELPRARATREFADRIVQAAGIEARALRLLRDDWQPGAMAAASQGSAEVVEEQDTADGDEGSENPGTVSAFGRVDTARATAADMIQGVSDDLADLEEMTTGTGRTMTEDFTLAFQAANLRWDTFHQDYDAFRIEQVELTSNQVVARLSDLVSQFSQVVLAARELPKAAGTRTVAQLMADTADSEDLALRQLRATFQKQDGGDGSSGAGDQDDGSGNGNADSGDLVAKDPTLFEGFEAQLVASNASRRQALETVADLNFSLTQEQLDIVSAFNEDYQTLRADWNGFHRDYDNWRLTEGGCDRNVSIEVLLQLGTQFNQLAADVGNLPNTPILRPLGELLVEAVRREASALTDLRDVWKPFDAEIYQPFRQERVGADKLRRQVAVGVQDLLEQYGLNEG